VSPVRSSAKSCGIVSCRFFECEKFPIFKVTIRRRIIQTCSLDKASGLSSDHDIENVNLHLLLFNVRTEFCFGRIYQACSFLMLHGRYLRYDNMGLGNHVHICWSSMIFRICKLCLCYTDNIKPSDIGLDEAFITERFRNGYTMKRTGSQQGKVTPPISYIHIYECEYFTVSICNMYVLF
jgi:hypothetical protein